METIYFRVNEFDIIFEEHDEKGEESSVKKQICIKEKYHKRKKTAFQMEAQNFLKRLWARLSRKTLEENEVPSIFFNVAISDHSEIKGNYQDVQHHDHRFRNFSQKKLRWMKNQNKQSQLKSINTNSVPLRNHQKFFSSSALVFNTLNNKSH
jgi:hypothetical protein